MDLDTTIKKEWYCMEQPKNIGMRKDLVLYRLQTAKEDLKSARILLEAEEYRGANNRSYYAVFRNRVKNILHFKKKIVIINPVI